MKINKTILATSFVLVLTAAGATATEKTEPKTTKAKTSIELGQKLFNDKTLGGSTGDKSCNSCHANGKGLEKAGNNPKLAEAINRCVVNMGGKKIDGRTVEMKSLELYIKSLAK